MDNNNDIAEIAYMYRVHHHSMTEKETPILDILFIAVPIMWIIFAFQTWSENDTNAQLTYHILFMAIVLILRILILFYENWFTLQGHHKKMIDEKHEIDTNRTQEREELEALYRLKGFEDPLLTDVIDTLMSDSNQLLKVMLEEELGLTLNRLNHPLKNMVLQFLAAISFLSFYWFYVQYVQISHHIVYLFVVSIIFYVYLLKIKFSRIKGKTLTAAISKSIVLFVITALLTVIMVRNYITGLC
jgi:hypothetical protein